MSYHLSVNNDVIKLHIFGNAYNKVLRYDLEEAIGEGSINRYRKFDVASQVDLSNSPIFFDSMRKLNYIFNIIEGWFDISNNKLKTLKRCPYLVLGYFNCSNNRLSSLRYCPDKVQGDFLAHNNLIKSLKFVPTHIQGSFDIADNIITSLIGIHKIQSCNNIDLSNNRIVEGGIGLIFIKHLDKILVGPDDDMSFIAAMKIINKYLRKGKTGLLPCANELEEAGLGAFAKL